MRISKHLGTILASVAIAVSVGVGFAVTHNESSDRAAQQTTISQQARTINGLSSEVSALKAKVATPASNLGFCFTDGTGETIDLVDGSQVTPVTYVAISPPAATYGNPCPSGTSYVPVTPQK